MRSRACDPVRCCGCSLLLAFVGIDARSLAHGTFDQLSIMREYAVNATRFAHELGQHLWLAVGSLRRRA